MSSVPASSLSVPLTQNTAPVIKFQCLFTHDVRRKAKRWQDGFLRFHTFNKRIMVYDVSGNFIGDLHWQTNANLQDGDELELEQGGVVVQVGECLEKTETDLTPLLEKKRPKKTATAGSAMNASPQKHPVSQSSRISTSSSVQYPADRLKSLNEVLGIKRNPIGKAALPARSPFEERHRSPDTDITETFQRPTKRQKRVPENENADTEDRGTTGQSRLVGQSSEAEGSRRNKLASRQPTADQVSGQSEPISFQSASTVKLSSSTSSSKSRRSSNKESSSRQKPISEAFSTDTSSNALRFPAQKPRNKLMCMELLSGSASEKKAKRQKDTVGTNEKDRPKAHRTNNLTPIAESRSENADDGTNTKSSVLTPTDPNSALAFIPSVSTLQALEEAAAPPSSQKDMAISDFFKPSRSRPPPQEPGRDENVSPHLRNSQPRSLARSHSDTTSIIPPAAPTATTSNPSLPPPPDRDPPRPRSPERSLQRSFSDVSSLRVSNNVTSRGLQTRLLPLTTTSDNLSSSLNDDEEERGAWTSEALDLFDWWPPGRPKPALRI